MTELEVHPIHPSLVRPVLFAGAEPAAAVFEGLTAGALLFGAGFHVATIGLAVFYLTVVHGVMVWVANVSVLPPVAVTVATPYPTEPTPIWGL